MTALNDRLQQLLISGELWADLRESFPTESPERRGKFNPEGLERDEQLINSWLSQLDRHVISQLFPVRNGIRTPPPITAHDLVAIAKLTFAGYLHDDLDRIGQCILEFVTRSRRLIPDEPDFDNETECDPVSIGRWRGVTEYVQARDDVDFVNESLWESEAGFRVQLCPASYEYHAAQLDRLAGKGEEADAQLVGPFTARAGNAVQDRLLRLGKSIATTVRYATTRSEAATQRAESEIQQALDALPGTELDPRDAPPSVGSIYFDPRPIECILHGDGRQLWSDCFDCVVCQVDDSELLLSRLQVAIELLAASDEAVSDAVGLALSVAAIEAVVTDPYQAATKTANDRQLCESLEESQRQKPGLSKQIKWKIPALLVPDSSLRSSQYGKKLRARLHRLYDLRSKALHGEKLNATHQARHATRRIASGVVRVAFAWRQVYGSENHPTTTAFLNDLNDAAFGKKDFPTNVDLAELARFEL